MDYSILSGQPRRHICISTIIHIEDVEFRNICMCREVEREQGDYMRGFGGRKRKRKIVRLYYNLTKQK